MPDYTKEQLLQFQKEINHYYKMRKLFLGLGWMLIGLSFVLFIVAIVVGIQNPSTIYPFSYIISFMFIGAIILFILRKALFDRRIKNRKQIIKEAKEQHEIEKLFEK